MMISFFFFFWLAPAYVPCELVAVIRRCRDPPSEVVRLSAGPSRAESELCRSASKTQNRAELCRSASGTQSVLVTCLDSQRTKAAIVLGEEKGGVVCCRGDAVFGDCLLPKPM